MKKTHTTPTRASHKATARHDTMEQARSEAERLEQERIAYETHARMTRTNLYNTRPPQEPARGWMDGGK